MKLYLKCFFFLVLISFISACCKDEVCVDDDYSPPRYDKCNDISDRDEKKVCADREMLIALYSAIKYPAEAKAKDIQGTVIVKIDIDYKGEVLDIFTTTSLGYGLEEECIRVVELISNDVGWRPARENCMVMRDTFILPVKFRLR